MTLSRFHQQVVREIKNQFVEQIYTVMRNPFPDEAKFKVLADLITVSLEATGGLFQDLDRDKLAEMWEEMLLLAKRAAMDGIRQIDEDCKPKPH